LDTGRAVEDVEADVRLRGVVFREALLRGHLRRERADEGERGQEQSLRGAAGVGIVDGRLLHLLTNFNDFRIARTRSARPPTWAEARAPQKKTRNFLSTFAG